jgi:hypothetical protein
VIGGQIGRHWRSATFASAGRRGKQQDGAVFDGAVADALVDGIGHRVGQVGVEQDLLGARVECALADRGAYSAAAARSCSVTVSGTVFRTRSRRR